jgi:type II secretory ATPase GspE/PulE/Tfp pilus assembly ATPase PilB-like protein
MILPPERNRAVRDALAVRGVVPAPRLDVLLAEAEETNRPLGDLLRESGLLTRPELTAALGTAMAWEPSEVGSPRRRDLPAVASAKEDRDDDPRLVTPDPFALEALDDLTFKLGRDATLVLGNLPSAPAPISHLPSPISHISSAPISQTPPVVALVDSLLHRAVRERASDLHFEPAGDVLQVRLRVDGLLSLLPPVPAGLEAAVVSRLKVLANLDLAEHRLPQDGRLRLEVDGRVVDLRISTLPTWSGESVVLRVLDPGAVRTGLDELGLPPDILAGFSAAIDRPHGLVLVTGPTGAGKTTTLYAALRRLNQPDVRIVTVEDPVEYEIDGVMQVTANPAAGLGFGPALRALLRQDPDVILVGEIRDAETARTAVQAALTGHLVLSTLHTNDAVGAVTRLLDLGIEPYLVAAALEGVLAQRLVRRLDPATGEGHGRTGVFEWMPVDEAWRDLVGAGTTGAALRNHVLARGLRPLATEAARLVSAGLTTPAEAARLLEP